MIQVEVAGQQIGLAQWAGRVYAFGARCPHASAPLVQGTLRPALVICPLHAYRFDLQSGQCRKPRDGPRLRVYVVDLREGDIWIRWG